MNNQSNSQPENNTKIPAQNSEQTINLDYLHKAFAQVCHCYGDLNHYYGFSERIDSKRIDWLLEEINNLAQAVEGLRVGGAK
ncbi:MAG: hypothetical protein ACXW1W_13465 [Methylococcaceae bacterium]